MTNFKHKKRDKKLLHFSLFAIFTTQIDPKKNNLTFQWIFSLESQAANIA